MDTKTATPGTKSLATLSVSAADVAALSGEELWALRGAVSTLVDVVCAVSCQPKFGDHDANGAGKIIEDILDAFNGLNGAINDVAASRLAKPECLTSDDAEMLGFVQLGYLVELRDSLPAVAVLATQAVEAERKAAFHSARKAGA